ncbi:hypothetical protein CEXT_177341 [Caerostris extrusa]|uniref:Uncharacterized protein n=1 Tax=Caerostris extrusa TaxID=172846 RepID=A0AAV4R7F7_CAEEX|nr:hypothetical protein CEXT_177341 [Caerostris extrusa]
MFSFWDEMVFSFSNRLLSPVWNSLAFTTMCFFKYAGMCNRKPAKWIFWDIKPDKITLHFACKNDAHSQPCVFLSVLECAIVSLRNGSFGTSKPDEITLHFACKNDGVSNIPVSKEL